MLAVRLAPPSLFGEPYTQPSLYCLNHHLPRPCAALPLRLLQVIASNDINDEMNQLDVPVFWPERRYPWGVAQAFNPDHSDLFFLRWGQPPGAVDDHEAWTSWWHAMALFNCHGQCSVQMTPWAVHPVSACACWLTKQKVKVTGKKLSGLASCPNAAHAQGFAAEGGTGGHCQGQARTVRGQFICTEVLGLAHSSSRISQCQLPVWFELRTRPALSWHAFAIRCVLLDW